MCVWCGFFVVNVQYVRRMLICSIVRPVFTKWKPVNGRYFGWKIQNQTLNHPVYVCVFIVVEVVNVDETIGKYFGAKTIFGACITSNNAQENRERLPHKISLHIRVYCIMVDLRLLWLLKCVPSPYKSTTKGTQTTHKTNKQTQTVENRVFCFPLFEVRNQTQASTSVTITNRSLRKNKRLHYSIFSLSLLFFSA